MDPVDRLFRQLVKVLVERDPDAATKSFEVAELYQTLLPYRTYRSALALDSVEDYEMAILRLLAGEGGRAVIEPPEAQQALREAAQDVNPDTGAFREYAGALVRLNRRAVAAVLAESLRYAPPGTEDDEAEEVGEVETAGETEGEDLFSSVPQSPATTASAISSPQCPDCGAKLPTHRTIIFCPYCAKQLQLAKCHHCGAEIEPGWQHCVTCGRPVTG